MKKILVISPGKGWGYFVSLIPQLNALYENFKKKITLYTLESTMAKSYLSKENFISEIFYLPKNKGLIKKFQDFFILVKQLKKIKPDTVFIFHNSLRYILASYFAGCSNIYSLGGGIISLLLKKKKRLYGIFDKSSHDPTSEYSNLLKKTLKIKKVKEYTLRFYKNLKKENKVAICIACSGYEKQWGIKNYAKLINYLYINKGIKKFLILAGKDQALDENKLEKKIKKKIIIFKTSNLNISDTVPLIKSCKYFIGNDTGFSHLSTLLGVKSLIIYGDCPPQNYSSKIFSVDSAIHGLRGKNTIKSLGFKIIVKKLKKFLN